MKLDCVSVVILMEPISILALADSPAGWFSNRRGSRPSGWQDPDQVGGGSNRRQAGNSRCDRKYRIQRTQRGAGGDSHSRRTGSWHWSGSGTSCGGGGSTGSGCWSCSMGGGRRRGRQCWCWSGGRGSRRTSGRQCRQFDGGRSRGLRRKIDPDSLFLRLNFTGFFFRRNSTAWNVGKILGHTQIVVRKNK